MLKNDPNAYFSLIYSSIGQQVDTDIVDTHSVLGAGQLSIGGQFYKTTKFYSFLKNAKAPASGLFSHGKLRNSLGLVRRNALSFSRSAASKFSWGEKKQDEECKVLFDKYFEEANARFCQRTGLSLSELGYQMARLPVT